MAWGSERRESVFTQYVLLGYCIEARIRCRRPCCAKNHLGLERDSEERCLGVAKT